MAAVIYAITDHTSSVDVPCSNPPSADVDVAKLRLELNEKSLEELVEDGVLRWNPERGVIMKGPSFDEERPLKN